MKKQLTPKVQKKDLDNWSDELVVHTKHITAWYREINKNHLNIAHRSLKKYFDRTQPKTLCHDNKKKSCMPEIVAKIEKISTVDAIANYIKKQIETGILKPGDQLPSERLLQAQLDVSRFALREALAKLSALGIIYITHGKGAFISAEVNRESLQNVFIPLFANLDINHLVDFFEARVLIESEAVVLCALRRSDDDVHDLQQIIDQSREAIDDPTQYAELDYLFHSKISQMSRNIFINKMLECLNDFIKEYLVILAKDKNSRQRSLSSHINIFECIKNKDAENAGRIIREHLSNTFKKISNLDANTKGSIFAEDFNKVFSLTKNKS